MRKTIMMAALLLAACGPADVEEASSSDSQETGSITAPEPTMVARDFDADVAFVASAETAEAMTVGEGLTVTFKDGEGLEISGKTFNPNSAGTTAGAAFVLTRPDEKRAAGHAIMVKISAKGEPGTTMKVAYSTNEVGNSGWSVFELTPEFETYSFDYTPSAIKAGRNDYIGIIPMGGPVIVEAAGVDIGAAVEAEPSTE